jgi:lysyl-tRNA synthetase class 2
MGLPQRRFSRENTAGKLDELYGDRCQKPARTGSQLPVEVKVAGRIMLKRVMGKASFAPCRTSPAASSSTSRDASAKNLCRVQDLGHGRHRRLRRHPVQDQDRRTDGPGRRNPPAHQVAAPAAGQVPRPHRQEQKYRQRYVDLIMNEQTRFTFVARSRIVQSIRNYMTATASSKSKRR